MNKPLLYAGAALLLIASVAVPASGHVKEDSRTYVSHCDAFVLVCATSAEDPTGGAVCEDGTCYAGALYWDFAQAPGFHPDDGGDGTWDAKVVLDDDVGADDRAVLCAAQERSPTDQEGNICNDPESEPFLQFCGESPWIEDAIQRPLDDADWIVVYLSGPVTQVVGHPGDEEQCDPLSAGATTGIATLRVRE